MERITVRPGETLTYLIKIGIFAALYYSTAKLGLGLDAVSGFATLFWLPTGISLAVIYLLGYRMLPGVFIGAFLANFTSGAALLPAVGIAIGNMLEALVGAYFLKRIVIFDTSLERLKDSVGLILLAACGSTIISATIGTVSLALGGHLTTTFSATWFAWWIGDVISNLIVAPFLFVWQSKSALQVRGSRLVEIILISLSIILISAFVFGGSIKAGMLRTPLTYLVFPPLIWLAIRFGPREVVTATFFLSLFAVWGTVQGLGAFARGSVSENLLLLQSFMIVVSVTILLLASVIAERRMLEKRKDDFVSFASHELKTPLTSIKVYTQMLTKEIPANQRKASRHLKRLDAQIEKLIHLVNDMLDLPKIQQGTLEYRKERFLLKSLIDDIAQTMQESTDDHVIIRRGGAKLEIYADKERIGQVLTNLISNAVKYSPPGARIVISTKRMKRVVMISVRDYGMGIPIDQQERIFDRFYRVTTGETKDTPGLGIGLYLSSMIVKSHGGSISVKSTEKKGSTFYFTLPLGS